MNLESALVLADELEERGDPRAELVRAQLQGREHGELLRAHWREWVGSLDPSAALLRWKWGQLVEVGLRAAPAGWTLQELLRKPTAGFLTRLALGPAVSSVGVEHARELRRLVCFGPLVSSELPTVETLTLDLDGPGAERLAALVARRLTTLHTRVTREAEVALFRSLARAEWFGALQTWTHRVASTESLPALLECRPLLARGGEGLVLLCDERVLQSLPPEVRRALPGAYFTLLPTPAQPHDPEDFHGPMSTQVVPVSAPMDFRARAAAETSSAHGTQSDEPVATTVGSGFPLGAVPVLHLQLVRQREHAGDLVENLVAVLTLRDDLVRSLGIRVS